MESRLRDADQVPSYTPHAYHKHRTICSGKRIRTQTHTHTHRHGQFGCGLECGERESVLADE
jgi:hypothetical protein